MSLGLVVLSSIILTAQAASTEPCKAVSRKLNDGSVVSAIQIDNPDGSTMFLNPTVTLGTVSYPLANATLLFSSMNAHWELCRFLSSGTHVKAEAIQRAKNLGVWFISESLKAFVKGDRLYRYQVHLGAFIEFDTIVKAGESSERELVGLLASVDRSYEVIQSITCSN